jgi:hypothetical protein
MNDEQLTKELEEALAVEPTPQFLARVRREIGSERSPLSARFRWTLIAAGTAATAVVAGIAMFQPAKPIALQPFTLSKQESLLPAPAIPAAQATKTVQKAVAKQVTRPAEPEVLIDPREVAALQSFLNDVQEQNITPASLVELFESAKRAERVTIETMPIAAIEPIVILPLSSAGPETGGDL